MTASVSGVTHFLLCGLQGLRLERCAGCWKRRAPACSGAQRSSAELVGESPRGQTVCISQASVRLRTDGTFMALLGADGCTEEDIICRGKHEDLER